MQKATPIEKSPRRLRACTLLTLRHLIYTCDWTAADIGRAIGYKDGTMVGRVMKLPHMPHYTPFLGTPQTFALAVVAAGQGFPLLSDEALPSDWVPIPAPEALPEGARLDGDTAPERLLLHDTAGLFGASAGDEVAQLRYSSTLLGAAHAIHQEARAALAPDLIAHAGDSMPAEVSITL